MTAPVSGKEVRRLGFHFGVGMLEAFGVLVLIGTTIMAFAAPTDDCDKSRFERCGMTVMTDAKTGKQYLVVPGGGIIERGKP